MALSKLASEFVLKLLVVENSQHSSKSAFCRIHKHEKMIRVMGLRIIDRKGH